MAEAKRILILGGTAFIGPAVVYALLARGCAVACFHRGSTGDDLAGVVHIRGDRNRIADHRDELRAFGADVVIDMLALTEAGTRRVLETLAPERYVLVSSCDVYRNYQRLHDRDNAPPDNRPADEDSPLRTRLYPYRANPPRADDDPMKWADDYDKIPLERMALAFGRGTVLRLPMVHGPGDRQHRIGGYLQRMLDGRPVIALGASLAAWRTTRGYVENVGEAVALAATDDRAVGRIYNVGEADFCTEREWVERIGRRVGWSGGVVVVPDERLPESMRPDVDFSHHLACSSDRIRQELGFREPVDPAEGLRRTIAWERDHPPPGRDAPDYEAEDRLLADLKNGGLAG